MIRLVIRRALYDRAHWPPAASADIIPAFAARSQEHHMAQELQSAPSIPASAAQVPASLRLLLTPGYQALRCHWKQFVFFQVLSLLMVIGYFHVDAVHSACQHLSSLKEQWGYLF